MTATHKVGTWQDQPVLPTRVQLVQLEWHDPVAEQALQICYDWWLCPAVMMWAALACW